MKSLYRTHVYPIDMALLSIILTVAQLTSRSPSSRDLTCMAACSMPCVLTRCLVVWAQHKILGHYYYQKCPSTPTWYVFVLKCFLCGYFGTWVSDVWELGPHSSIPGPFDTFKVKKTDLTDPSCSRTTQPPTNSEVQEPMQWRGGFREVIESWKSLAPQGPTI